MGLCHTSKSNSALLWSPDPQRWRFIPVWPLTSWPTKMTFHPSVTLTFDLLTHKGDVSSQCDLWPPDPQKWHFIPVWPWPLTSWPTKDKGDVSSQCDLWPPDPQRWRFIPLVPVCSRISSFQKLRSLHSSIMCKQIDRRTDKRPCGTIMASVEAQKDPQSGKFP